MSEQTLTFATQGGEFSYHALAARKIARDVPVEIDAKKHFGEVIRASRCKSPGLGVIAVSTVAGTVEDSAKELVRKRVSALPPVVGRVDIPIELSLIGSRPQTVEELGKKSARCLVQKPAYLQCKGFLDQHLPHLGIRWRESTQAITEIVRRDSLKYVAIGPTFAAEPLGGVILGPNQINPPDSVTSFYALQRDPRQQILPVDPDKTAPRTVITLAHPEGPGEMAKCAELCERVGVNIGRFIPYDIGDFTKHNSGLMRGGGIVEVNGDRYDEEVTEWCARVNGLKSNDGADGPFSAKILGVYPWYHEPDMDLARLDY